MPSDINQHVTVLAEYASRCASVLELGVRSGVSSWAFLQGLTANGQDAKRLVGVDLERHSEIDEIARIAAENGVQYTFVTGNDLDVATEAADLTFIDTWHVYGQLRRELAKFAPLTRSYIIMHDTEVDGARGESVRCGWDAAHQALATGIPEEEILKGLRPAITEFLDANPEWRVDLDVPHNNGLTVLARR